MQLLKIKTTPIDYEINIQGARLETAQLENATVSLKNNPLRIDSQTEGVKMRMDSSAMRSSLGMQTVAEAAKEAPAKTQQTANKTTSDYVHQGNSMLEKGMDIAQFMKQKMLSGTTLETNIGAIPSERIDVSWEPASVKHDVKRSSVDMDWKKSAHEMEFIPSSFSLEVKQLAEVEIEYIGGFQYVPPSSDPNYEEEQQ